MAYLYTPPQYTVAHHVKGTKSMYHKDTWSTTVWRTGGLWFNAVEPAAEDVEGNDFFFNTPTVIDPSLVAELTAFGVGTITTI